MVLLVKTIIIHHKRLSIMKYLVFSLLLMPVFILKSQDKSPELPRFSIRVNCGIPKLASSELLRNTFSGIINAEASLNCKLFSNFFVGVGYSYSYSKSQDALRKQNINPNMQMQNGYLKIGYDHFFSENGFTTISLNVGSNFTSFSGIQYYNDSLKGKYPTQFVSGFVEPQLGVYLIVDPNLAIGGNIGYNYNFSQFDSRYPGTDKWLPNSSGLSNKWNISSITLCFGMYIGLGKKK